MKLLILNVKTNNNRFIKLMRIHC